MKCLARRVRDFVVEEDGATMAEYALLIGLIALVVAATLLSIGTSVRTKFSSASACMQGGTNCT